MQCEDEDHSVFQDSEFSNMNFHHKYVRVPYYKILSLPAFLFKFEIRNITVGGK
jgi:hypothetical protein